MTPGVFVEITDHHDCKKTWKSLWSTIPTGWKKLKVSKHMTSGGLKPGQVVQLETPKELGRVVQLTIIFNSFHIQLLSILPVEDQYVKELTDKDYRRITKNFMDAFVSPQITTQPDVTVEYFGSVPKQRGQPLKKSVVRAVEAARAEPKPKKAKPATVVELPDVMALRKLPWDRLPEDMWMGKYRAPYERTWLDREGLWWTLPFAAGAGDKYAFRLAPGAGHGAVLRCSSGHAVTIASTPDRAIFAMLAVGGLLGGPKSRARIHAAWKKARGILRDAVAITGGDPDRLDEILHVADDLPKWTSPGTAAEVAARRAMLLRITGDETSDDGIWGRWLDSARAPDDADAALRLLQGNHGLDGTHCCGGLLADADDARELLVASAKRIKAAKRKPDAVWAPLVEAIAKRGEPKPEDFIAAALRDPVRGWDALAAASFWYKAVGGESPAEVAKVAMDLAKAAGAKHVLAARALIRDDKDT